MAEFSFPKIEKLCYEPAIQNLFAKRIGIQYFSYPLITRFGFITLPREDSLPVAQVLFSVPKRNFKKAHDRNLIKRHLREAYRLNKHIICSEIKPPAPNSTLAIVFSYIAKQPIPSHEVHQAMCKHLKYILSHLPLDSQ